MSFRMRFSAPAPLHLLSCLAAALLLGGTTASAYAQATPATLPTFSRTYESGGKDVAYTVAGRSPEAGGTTTIPTVLVPLSLTFDNIKDGAGKKLVVTPGAGAGSATEKVLHSPIFEPYAFATGNTQYGDAVQRAEFFKTGAAKDWHTLLGQPRVIPVSIEIPADRGYVLTSKRSGSALAVVDLDYVQRELAKQLAQANFAPGSLVMAIAKNTAWYTLEDATVCCSLGTHGILSGAASHADQAFLISSYMDAGSMPHMTDIQGITEQLVEWMNDPLHGQKTNVFPRWLKPTQNVDCGGKGEGSSYLFAQPTDSMPGELKPRISNATLLHAHGSTYHVENVALLPWYTQSAATETFQSAYSFPDTHALTTQARPCMDHEERLQQHAAASARPLPSAGNPNGHALIGYWEGYGTAQETFPLRDVSPQWDVVIVTFASPAKGSTSLLQFSAPKGMSDDQLKADVAYLQHKGKKVLISLGGGGAVVTINTDAQQKEFVDSVSSIVKKYGFNGVDLDIETPSILLQPGDTDFRKPTTPSVLHLISAMHQMRSSFGPSFMIAEVPEDAQTQAGMQTYAGQFGSFLPVIYGTRDILSFVDAQDYNTPPLEGLDGNYYFPGNANYHVAVTEMMLHGFAVNRDPKLFFPPLPASKVATGLPATPTSARNYTEIPVIEQAMRRLTTGQTYPGATYTLQQPGGYPHFLGAMFWAINEDAQNGYAMSNAIGPLLHGFAAGK